MHGRQIVQRVLPAMMSLCVILSGGGAFSTQPAQTKAGVEAGGGVPVSLEGGFSFQDVRGGGAESRLGSGFIGARATWAQGATVGITGMFRYHFENSGFYQAGAGVFGPIGKGTGLYYQLDYYRL